MTHERDCRKLLADRWTARILAPRAVCIVAISSCVLLTGDEHVRDLGIADTFSTRIAGCATNFFWLPVHRARGQSRRFRCTLTRGAWTFVGATIFPFDSNASRRTIGLSRVTTKTTTADLQSNIPPLSHRFLVVAR